MAGESSRSIQYRKPAEQAYNDVRRAFEQIGRIESASETTLSVSGKTMHGLQSVKLRVSVIEKDETNSLLQIQAAGDDVWAGGARGGTDRLIQSLEALDNPTCDVGKQRGWNPMWWFALLLPVLWLIAMLH